LTKPARPSRRRSCGIPRNPFLYTAATTVSDGTTPVDDYKTTFGIRSIKWTADQGFFINGEHYYFHGANVHQDHAGGAMRSWTTVLFAT